MGVRVCACTCECMCGCARVCMCCVHASGCVRACNVHVYVCAQVRVCAVHECMCVRTCVCVCMCARVSAFSGGALCMCVHMYACAYVQVCTRVYVGVHVCLRLCVCVRVEDGSPPISPGGGACGSQDVREGEAGGWGGRWLPGRDPAPRPRWPTFPTLPRGRLPFGSDLSWKPRTPTPTGWTCVPASVPPLPPSARPSRRREGCPRPGSPPTPTLPSSERPRGERREAAPPTGRGSSA